MQTLQQKLQVEIEALSNRAVPHHVVDLLKECLHKINVLETEAITKDNMIELLLKSLGH